MTAVLRIAPLLLAFSLVPSSAAVAADKLLAYEAQLAAPAKKAEATAGGVTWSCKADRCTASARGGKVSVRGCTELSRQVGKVTRYASEIMQLADRDLEACAQGLPVAAVRPGPKGPGKPLRATTDELAFTGLGAVPIPAPTQGPLPPSLLPSATPPPRPEGPVPSWGPKLPGAE